MATISQTIYFDVPPEKIYHAYLDSDIHSLFTGSTAKIDPTIGGEFSVWDGYATGHNQELVPNQKIVQTWRASDWAEGVVSTVTFDFFDTSNGTKLIFTQTDIPEDQKEDIAQGWEDYYWSPLHKYFKTN